MYVPKIQTNKGLQPITVLPNNMLLEVYMNSSACAEDKDLARYLSALDDAEYAGALLRCCFSGARLVVVYPALNQAPPEGARFITSVEDGGLYLVPATVS